MRGAILFFILWAFSSAPLISTVIYTCDSTVSCGCSTLSTVVTSRIVGGEPASNNTWGWMLSLRRSGSHLCGASLLTPEYAITAAHCVSNDPSSLSILAGTNNLDDQSNKTAQTRTVTKIIVHPNFNSNILTNDIAIIQFSPLTVSTSSNLAFVCLPSAYQDPFQTNTDLIAIGWGVTSYGSNTQSNILRQVTVQAFSSTSSDCLQSGLTNANVQFCAGVDGGGKDTCQGDSGGPLMAFVSNRWVLAGVTSFGYECAQPDYPGVYTRVSAFTSFIQSNTDISLVKMTIQTNYGQSKYKSTIDKFMFISIFLFLLFVFLSFSS